jgi:hypothetical protein
MFEAHVSSLTIAPVGLFKVDIGAKAITVSITCKELDRPLPYLAQICSSLPSLSTVEYLYQRGQRNTTSLAGQHREHAMVGSITYIYRREEPLSIPGICATYFPCPSTALLRKCDGTATEIAENFLEDFWPTEPAKMATWQFVVGRHVDSYPIAIAHRDKELDTWKEDDKG